MENNEILESDWNNSSENIKEKRGVFLLVLCILSWIGTGIGLLSGIFTLIKGVDDLENQMAIIEQSNIGDAGNPLLDGMMSGSLEMIRNSIDNFYPLHISTIILVLLGAFSVYMMYNLKKTGYFLYIIYAIGAPILSFVFLGTSSLVWAAVGLNLFFSIAFVIMYGVNLNRMTE